MVILNCKTLLRLFQQACECFSLRNAIKYFGISIVFDIWHFFCIWYLVFLIVFDVWYFYCILFRCQPWCTEKLSCGTPALSCSIFLICQNYRKIFNEAQIRLTFWTFSVLKYFGVKTSNSFTVALIPICLFNKDPVFGQNLHLSGRNVLLFSSKLGFHKKIDKSSIFHALPPRPLWHWREAGPQWSSVQGPILQAHVLLQVQQII